MKSAKFKSRTLKFSENEILAVSAVLTSILEEGRLRSDIPFMLVEDFADVYHRFISAGDAIANRKMLEKSEARRKVVLGLMMLADGDIEIEDINAVA